ncbi:hypothetical protein ACJU26_05350 [Acidithiobacillus sp. M4-SHS-6]|uniref:hypothetical protein n=1 Tax=Acidithiobacillus sp. M4-SHS-6 TaxID=3383024 RepID=UPI0039BE350C
MTELEKIEAQIQALTAKKEALKLGIPASKTELRKAFTKALPGESYFGLSFLQILGALDVVRTRGVTEEQGAELERLGREVLKKYVERPADTDDAEKMQEAIKPLRDTE